MAQSAPSRTNAQLQHAVEAYPGPDAVSATSAAMPRMNAWRAAGWEVMGQVWDTSGDGPTTLEQFAFAEESLLVKAGGRLVVTYQAPPGTPHPSLPVYVEPESERWSPYLQLKAIGIVVFFVLFLLFVFLPMLSRMSTDGPRPFLP
jgi:hypothetical protein